MRVSPSVSSDNKGVASQRRVCGDLLAKGRQKSILNQGHWRESSFARFVARPPRALALPLPQPSLLRKTLPNSTGTAPDRARRPLAQLRLDSTANLSSLLVGLRLTMGAFVAIHNQCPGAPKLTIEFWQAHVFFFLMSIQTWHASDLNLWVSVRAVSQTEPRSVAAHAW